MKGKHTSFILSAIVFIIALCFVYPFCQYYIDPDATAYLTISKRYAAGDIDRAINGYWSPWSCWLTALLIKTGLEAFKAAIIVNAAGALCFLYISHSFFTKFLKRKDVLFALEMALAVFLVYAVFKQTFADLWECFFLLVVLRIMISERFAARPVLWIAIGVIGTLAYFAKAYSFPFFILSVVVCSYFITTNKKQWLKISMVSIVTMIVCSFPWIYLLHEKYGTWMTSTAGSLNLSWYLVGHPEFKEGIDILLPPPYADSPYYWEDPYYVNGATSHFWDSGRLFKLQIIRVGYNILKLVNSMNELSAFFLPVSLLAFLIVFSKKIKSYFPEKTRVIAISFLLFPLGFLLINFEARYIWYMLPLAMLFGGMALEYLFAVIDKKFLRRIALVVFAGSFLVFPVYDLRNLIGIPSFSTKMLERSSIKGSFAANDQSRIDVQKNARLAYRTGNQYYTAPYFNTDSPNLLKELRGYNIRYFFYYFHTEADSAFVLKNEEGTPFPMVLSGNYLDLKVFLINP